MITVQINEIAGNARLAGQVVARVGPCSLGNAGQVYAFSGSDVGSVEPLLGNGRLAADTRRALRIAGQACLAVPSEIDTLGTISAVEQTGAGPAVTMAATPADAPRIEGPWFDAPNVTIQIVTSGALGTARARVLLDGYTPSPETFNLPPELPASAIGTADLAAFSAAQFAALNTRTFIANPDGNGPFTTTFAGVADYQDVVDQIQDSFREAATLLGSADLTAYTPSTINGKTLVFSSINGDNVGATVTFAAVVTLADIITQIAAVAGITATLEAGDFVRITSDVLGDTSEIEIGSGTANADLGFTAAQSDVGAQYATAALVGGRYLRITAETNGTTGTLAIGSGTANADLGFTDNSAFVGIASTYEIPGIGIIATFPAGAYVKNTRYAVDATGPRSDLAGILAALDALRASGKDFGLIAITQEPVDGLDLAAWQSALEAKRIEWATAEENPLFTKWIIGSPLGLEGSANWSANDQDVMTNLAGTQEANKLNTIVHGDVFLEFEEYGSARFRAPLAIPYLESCAKYELSVNPGLGSKKALPRAYLTSTDGTIRARTEATAITKMQDYGFSVLLNEKEEPFIRSGVTRAPITSQFIGEHTARMALVLATVARAVAFQYKDSTPQLASSGDLEPVAKGTITLVFNDTLDKEFVRRGWASSIVATLQPLVAQGGADLLPVRINAQRLGFIKDATITINVTAEAVTVEG